MSTQRHSLRDEVLDPQRERLAELEAGTERLTLLRERECKLEVDLIAADAALKAASQQNGPSINPDKAAAIVAALRRTRRLQGMLEAHLQEAGQARGSSDEISRLTSGRDALQSWLDAPQVGRPPSLSPPVRGMLAASVAACVLAALTLHPLFLLLLAPVLLLVTFIKWSRQNEVWLRLGAERRYTGTGLKPPAAWKAPAVSRRLAELERSMKVLSEQSQEPTGDGDDEQDKTGRLTDKLLQSQALLRTTLAETNLAGCEIDQRTEQLLTLSAQVHRARGALAAVREERARLRADLEENREALFRFLSRHGEAPSDGRADPGALDAGLKRLAGQSVNRGAPSID